MPPNQTPAARRRRLPRPLSITAAVAMILAACSSAHRPAPPLNTEGARILHLTIVSRYVTGKMPMTLVTPAGGGTHRPLLVFLHGIIYDNNSQLTNQMFAALHALGPRAPDIAFPYGDQSYWYNRASGAWGSYVLDEVIPKALSALDADPRRVAIGGISMGGFGAAGRPRLHILERALGRLPRLLRPRARGLRIAPHQQRGGPSAAQHRPRGIPRVAARSFPVIATRTASGHLGRAPAA